MGPLDLLLGFLLVVRATRLVVADSITEEPRQRLEGWASAGGWRWYPAELLTCRWCVSVWLAAGAWAWWWWHAPSWRAAAAVAGWSWLTGAAGRLEG